MTLIPSKPKQRYFDFDAFHDYSDEKFYKASCNLEAYYWVKHWPKSEFPITFSCIYGPKHSGKKHLLHIWKDRVGAFEINDFSKSPYEVMRDDQYFILPHIDQVKEHEWLFHFYNAVKERGGFVLTSAYTKPQQWETKILDLATRFKTFHALEIKNPDHLDILLKKMLNDYGIILSEFQIQYILKRIERSFKSLYDLAGKIDLLQKTKGELKFKDICDILICAGDESV